MNKRLATNTNIKLFQGNEYDDLPILNYVMSEGYLKKIKDIAHYSLHDHTRSLVIRADLRVPLWMGDVDTALISRFFASLKAQIKSDLEKKASAGTRVYPCNLRYVWAKEQDLSWHCHYHTLFFLNKDAYHTLGDITAMDGNMAARIKKAWASALGLGMDETDGLVQFCGAFHLDNNSPWINAQLSPVFEAASYLAKVATKNYGDRTKHFSCSHF